MTLKINPVVYFGATHSSKINQIQRFFIIGRPNGFFALRRRKLNFSLLTVRLIPKRGTTFTKCGLDYFTALLYRSKFLINKNVLVIFISLFRWPFAYWIFPSVFVIRRPSFTFKYFQLLLMNSA